MATLEHARAAAKVGGIVSERNLNSTQLDTSDKEMIYADEPTNYHNVSFMCANDFEKQSNPETVEHRPRTQYMAPLIDFRQSRALKATSSLHCRKPVFYRKRPTDVQLRCNHQYLMAHPQAYIDVNSGSNLPAAFS